MFFFFNLFQYPSVVIDNKHSTFEKPVDCALLPAMVHKSLIGTECLEKCTEACKEPHKCDPDDCMSFCRFKKMVSGGDVPFTDSDGKKTQHTQMW